MANRDIFPMIRFAIRFLSFDYLNGGVVNTETRVASAGSLVYRIRIER